MSHGPAEPTPSDLVRVLYRGLLGRDPDPGGLLHWAAEIESGAGIWDLVAAFMASPEYAAGLESSAGWLDRADRIGKRLRDLFEPAPLVIVDVGAQILDYEDHVYSPLMSHGIPCRIIGFEPLDHRRTEWREGSGNVRIEMHPTFIGDGARHRFHINEPDATSSLLPFNRAVLDHLAELNGLYTVETIEVETETLDAVLGDERNTDFLKLDIQGFELPALRHAGGTLERTQVIQCEVSFVEIYEGQALFGDVEAYLRRFGFRFVDFVHECRYSLQGAAVATRDQLGWADAVFFRELDEGEDPRSFAAQAAMASLVYGKWSLGSALAAGYDALTGSNLGGLFAS